MIVFVDWQNLYNGARRAFHGGRGDGVVGQVWPREVGELIAARGEPRGVRELEQVRIYRGFPSEKQDAVGHAATRQQKETWELDRKVKVFPHTLQRGSHACQQCGWERWSPKCPQCGKVKKLFNEKGVDVSLAVDMISLAHQGAYEVAVVFSTDTDFNPAIKLGLELGVQVENALWWTDVRHGDRPLLSGTIWHHRLRIDDYEWIHDPNSYVPEWARRASSRQR